MFLFIFYFFRCQLDWCRVYEKIRHLSKWVTVAICQFHQKVRKNVDLFYFGWKGFFYSYIMNRLQFNLFIVTCCYFIYLWNIRMKTFNYWWIIKPYKCWWTFFYWNKYWDEIMKYYMCLYFSKIDALSLNWIKILYKKWWIYMIKEL